MFFLCFFFLIHSGHGFFSQIGFPPKPSFSEISFSKTDVFSSTCIHINLITSTWFLPLTFIHLHSSLIFVCKSIHLALHTKADSRFVFDGFWCVFFVFCVFWRFFVMFGVLLTVFDYCGCFFIWIWFIIILLSFICFFCICWRVFMFVL